MEKVLSKNSIDQAKEFICNYKPKIIENSRQIK